MAHAGAGLLTETNIYILYVTSKWSVTNYPSRSKYDMGSYTVSVIL